MSLSNHSFLIQPNEEYPWVAIVMTPDEKTGELVPTTPPQIGGGDTPPAALMRVLTTLREKDPTPEQARETMNRLLVTTGTSQKALAQSVPFTLDEVRAALSPTEDPYPVTTYLQFAEAIGIPLTNWTHTLRGVQREEDTEHDGSSIHP